MFLESFKVDQMQMHSFMLTEMYQKHIKNALSMHVPGWTHTHIWAYIPLGTSVPSNECSMDTYFILWWVHFQGVRCVTYTLWLRELLISQIWYFWENRSKTGTEMFQRHFGNASFMTVNYLRAYSIVVYRSRTLMNNLTNFFLSINLSIYQISTDLHRIKSWQEIR